MKRFRLILGFVLLTTLCGCMQSTEKKVVVYTALDQEFSGPIFEGFTKETEIEVRPKYDTESTKTVGLAEAIIAERSRPRCDVFWNNEILHTLRLKKQGLVEAYHPPIAESYPAMVRAADGTWHGFAARARVLIVNTDLLPESERPQSILELADPKWKGKAGLAKPLFGTTATHAACLFATWGEDRAKEFFGKVKGNISIESGNKQVALSVAAGQLAWGVTDTDDAIIEVEKGMPVVIVYPDQQPDGLGTLFIPNTLSIIKGAPHPEAARALIDYLLSPSVEAALAQCASAQIPLNPAVKTKVRVETPQTVRAMQADFAKAADAWQTAVTYMRDEFTSP